MLKQKSKLTVLGMKIAQYNLPPQHKEFWLPVVLFLNFNMFNFIQCIYVNVFNLLVGFY